MMKCLLLTLALAAATSAQTKPDFSGTWVIVSPAEGAGQEQQVQHTPTTLTAGHASSGDGHSATYKLDGTESRNELTSHGEKIVTIARASWDGDKVVITKTTTYPDGRKMDAKQAWFLDSTGRLIVEHSMIMTGMAPQSMTVVHRKKDK